MGGSIALKCNRGGEKRKSASSNIIDDEPRDSPRFLDKNVGLPLIGARVSFLIHKTKEAKAVEEKHEKWICAHCGYTADGKFVGDICPQCDLTYWKCAKCGFLVTAGTTPATCPECGEKCNFLNVTCYTPECGGPGHVDRRL